MRTTTTPTPFQQRLSVPKVAEFSAARQLSSGHTPKGYALSPLMSFRQHFGEVIERNLPERFIEAHANQVFTSVRTLLDRYGGAAEISVAHAYIFADANSCAVRMHWPRSLLSFARSPVTQELKLLRWFVNVQHEFVIDVHDVDPDVAEWDDDYAMMHYV